MQDIFNISTPATSSGRIRNNQSAFPILPNGSFWWHLSPSLSDPIMLSDNTIVCAPAWWLYYCFSPLRNEHFHVLLHNARLRKGVSTLLTFMELWWDDTWPCILSSTMSSNDIIVWAPAWWLYCCFSPLRNEPGVEWTVVYGCGFATSGCCVNWVEQKAGQGKEWIRTSFSITITLRIHNPGYSIHDLQSMIQGVQFPVTILVNKENILYMECSYLTKCMPKRSHQQGLFR